ncbi:ABC transporter ATP-binding protein [Streptococcus sp. ZJ93]|uniref:ABC transporter ATP-binding protein n=1 Tax=Streptococcus handemini TaxID=3161188 RepID=UPI0032ED42C9
MKQLIFPTSHKSRVLFFFGIVTALASTISYVFIPESIRTIVDNHQFNLHKISFIGILLVLNLTLSFLSSLATVHYAEAQITTLRQTALEAILSNKLTFFKDHLSGELGGQMISNTENIRVFLSQTLTEALSSLLLICLSFIMLFRLDVQLTLVMFGGLIILIALLAPIALIGGKYTKQKQESLATLSGFLIEIFQNIKLIKLNQLQQAISQRYQEKNNHIHRHSIKLGLVEAFIKPLMTLLVICIIGLLFAYGGYRVATSTLTTGTLISFLVYLFQLLSPFSAIGQFGAQLQKTKENLELVEQYIQAPKEENGSITCTPDSLYHLSTSNLSLSYGGENILSDINFEIHKGEKVALVGPSGAGKSTIIDIVTKLYTDYSGDITLNHVPLREIDTRFLRQHLSLVTQENQLFSGTILENLTLGLTEEISEQELKTALDCVNLTSEIEKFKDGLNTILGENGAGLSGGQKQRLQIARAMLRKADFYIFDEAIANLDVESEEKVLHYIKHSLQDKLLIFITHKLSTITSVDKIIFLDQGSVTGIGTHEELMNSHKKYREYIEKQEKNNL